MEDNNVITVIIAQAKLEFVKAQRMRCFRSWLT